MPIILHVHLALFSIWSLRYIPDASCDVFFIFSANYLSQSFFFLPVYIYRVTIKIVPNLPLTPKQRLRFSTYLHRPLTCVLMSTGGWEQHEWWPCNFFTFQERHGILRASSGASGPMTRTSSSSARRTPSCRRSRPRQASIQGEQRVENQCGVESWISKKIKEGSWKYF